VPGCCDPDHNRSVFSDRFARRQCKRYQRPGLTPAAQGIGDFRHRAGLAGATVLEIGGGPGELQVFVLARCLSLVERSHDRHDGADCAARSKPAERC
jgi:magnesium-protoporphyrin O-methyltransferase